MEDVRSRAYWFYYTFGGKQNDGAEGELADLFAYF